MFTDHVMAFAFVAHSWIIISDSKGSLTWDYEQLMTFLKSKYTGRNEFIATVIAMYSGMRLGEICDLKNKDIYNGCFHVKEGKTPSAARVIPIHPVIKPIIENLKKADTSQYLES